jgi:hypothetical protein
MVWISSILAYSWVVICAAKLLNVLHPTRLLTGGLLLRLRQQIGSENRSAHNNHKSGGTTDGSTAGLA